MKSKKKVMVTSGGESVRGGGNKVFLISLQIVDRPTQGRRFLSREYVQPQWLYGCVNARIILPVEKYMLYKL